MNPLYFGLIVLGVLLLCVAGMAIGVMFGRKPIKHCGGAINEHGEREACSLCGNHGQCKREKLANATEA